MATVSITIDPTLAAVEAAVVSAMSSLPRPYLGASSIGHPCSRSLWYGFRWAVSAEFSPSSATAIQDGHRGEALMIERLRAVKGITLWTDSPDAPGKQIGFTDLAGHFCGNLDGVIEGLLQAPPDVPHVWECKVCNEGKVARLIKAKQTHGEGKALAEWDAVYFAQAQVYMHYMEISHHYLTVCTPGVRSVVSCITDYDEKQAKSLIEKAKRIITADRPPEKLSKDPAWWQCKGCNAHALCHNGGWPDVNCRTCAHSTAALNSDASWRCDFHKRVLPVSEQRHGCNHHAFHPDLLVNHATVVKASATTGSIAYKCHNGEQVINGLEGTRSKEWNVPLEEQVLNELVQHTGLSHTQITRGKLSETDWGKIPLALSIMGVTEALNPRKFSVLKSILELCEKAYWETAT